MRRLILATCLLASFHAWSVELPPDSPIDPAVAPSVWLDALHFGTVPTMSVRRYWQRADAAKRLALVETAFAWARGHSASPMFRSGYEQLRELARPMPPVDPGSVDDAMAQQDQEMQVQFEAMRASLAQLPADQRDEMEAAIREAEEAMRAAQSDPEVMALQRQGMQAEFEAEQQRYQQALSRWNDTLPEDPQTLIARRLTQFIDVCGTVDFDAALVAQGGMQRFADPAHEAKRWEWKLCYRAGAAPVRRAMALAREWLQTLR